MSSSRMVAAVLVVVAFVGAAYVWTRPATRIDQTVTTGGSSSTPPARRR